MRLTLYSGPETLHKKCFTVPNRTVKHPVQGLANPHRLILDGELIWKYLYLSMNEKMELARRMGTAVEQVRLGVQDE